ncbi:hypothetical protein CAL20_01840 [Bordetella genomosp. 4]|uniref:Probable membrane transporter protein n=1 Tax=Bordetella genomosp. 4 TaxID=463044 RepID=A0A261V1J8_9BORD|nr:hypothetical protein CAL21_00500 [Bordetella genomosp. 4]OZI67805.1 hypothetical protein CAL20_01840 [Bordetella genomosp. 4]
MAASRLTCCPNINQLERRDDPSYIPGSVAQSLWRRALTAVENYVYVLVVALIAGAFSGVVGTGSSLMLLPVLVQSYGPKAAMPIMAMAAIMGNLSRVMVWYKQIDWRATFAYGLPGIPAAALGAHTLLALPAWVIDATLGFFFWCMIPIRHKLRQLQYQMSLFQLGVCGVVIGFLTGLVLSTGPLSIPAFTAYGLSGGAFLGTDGATSVLLYISKVSTFFAQDALSMQTALQGVLVGAGIMLGTVASKPLVLRLSSNAFALMVDVLLFVSGAALLYSAWSHG